MIDRFKILEGKNVLVTGATGGIGFSICKLFSYFGSNVFATGRNKDKLKLLSRSIPDIVTYCSDLSSLKSIEDLNKKVYKDSSGIDILVNNAGFFSIVPMDKISNIEYNKFFNINVRAPILLSSFHSSYMKNKLWGRIFNIGSSSCYNGGKDTSLYCSSKHALLGFSKSISDELKDYNVRVVNLSPSSTKTDMGKVPLVTPQDYNTFINPDEIAEMLVFLCCFNDNMEVRELLLNRVRVQ